MGILNNNLKILPWLFSILISINYATAQAQAENTPTIQDRYQQALELMNAFQFDRAQELLSTCYIEAPENVDYLNKIAYCNFQLGRYRDAKIFYNEILKIDALNATALSSLGSIYEREGNYRLAKQTYENLIRLDTTNSYYFKRNGYMALRLGDALDGIANFLKAHTLNESDIEVIDQLCNIYLSLGELDYTEQILEKGLRMDGKNINLLYNKARLAQKSQDHPIVVEAIEQAMALGDTSNYYQMMLGVAYLKIDSVDQAIEHLEMIVAREKASEHTHHYLGLAYLEKNELDTAIVHLNKAIEKGISEKITTYHADLASMYVKKNDHKAAIEHYQSAFNYSGEATYLFHVAHHHDLYYKDKRMAMRYYQRYLAGNDDKFRDYSAQRVAQLKELLHFQK